MSPWWQTVSSTRMHKSSRTNWRASSASRSSTPARSRRWTCDTILKSLEKTGRLVVVDESWESRSTASEIAAQVVDLGFDLLDAPIRRVTIPNMPLPGGHMEPYVAPNPDAIEAAVRDVCR